MATKNDILNDVFLLYWLYDEEPDLSPTTTDDRVIRLLKVYDSLKSAALAEYPWRSAIKYKEITTSVPVTNIDGKYKYTATLPDDFLKEDGFWNDWERNTPCPQSVEIVGKTAKTNLTKFTLGYISGTIDEEDLDSWVADWLGIYIAAEAAALASVPADRINFLIQQKESEFANIANIDWRNAHHNDDNTLTLGQFLYT